MMTISPTVSRQVGRRIVFVALLLVLLFQLFYRLGGGELIGDEVTPIVTASAIKSDLSQGLGLRSLYLYGQPPLRVGLAWIASNFNAMSEALIRFPHAFLGLLTALMIARFMRPYSKLASLIALGLIIGSGMAIVSRVAIGLSAFHFFLLGSYIAWWNYLQKGEIRWLIIAWVAFALGGLTYLEGWFFLPSYFLLALFYNRSRFLDPWFYIVPVVIAASVAHFYINWFTVPLKYVAQTGKDILDFGGWRIIDRGGPILGNYSALNYDVLATYSRRPFVIIWLFLVVFGLAYRPTRPVALFTAIPVAYFLFYIARPLIHFVNFYPFLVMLGVGGAIFLLERTRLSGASSLFLAAVLLIMLDVVRFHTQQFIAIQTIDDPASYTWGQNLSMGLRETAKVIRETGDPYYAHLSVHDATAVQFYVTHWPRPLGQWEDPTIRWYLLDPAVARNEPIYRYCQTNCRLVQEERRQGKVVATLFERNFFSH